MRGVDGPYDILCQVDSQEPDVIHTLRYLSIYMQREMSGPLASLKVYNDLFGFCGSEVCCCLCTTESDVDSRDCCVCEKVLGFSLQLIKSSLETHFPPF